MRSLDELALLDNRVLQIFINIVWYRLGYADLNIYHFLLFVVDSACEGVL